SGGPPPMTSASISPADGTVEDNLTDTPQTDLVQMALAVHPPRRFPRPLNRREHQPDQHCDDADHDQQLEECETPAMPQGSLPLLDIQSLLTRYYDSKNRNTEPARDHTAVRTPRPEGGAARRFQPTARSRTPKRQSITSRSITNPRTRPTPIFCKTC